MHHHPVEPARGEDGVEQDDGLGTEADEIAGLGTAGVRSTADCTGDDAGIAHHLAAILLTHALSGLDSLSLVSTYIVTFNAETEKYNLSEK